jgi:hypothetical protein
MSYHVFLFLRFFLLEESLPLDFEAVEELKMLYVPEQVVDLVFFEQVY